MPSERPRPFQTASGTRPNLRARTAMRLSGTSQILPCKIRSI
ncbi:TPA: hypothetical protein ACUV4A_000439 [Neisseria gonorrhoeae]|uniref:Uncharacterized protein n=1 Tax=Neisseria gonorrhoeae (strain NCCP11945) TaxID=521006 RepID=B4RJI5_NEIG2|nr:hypothetical protein [Neisseria gonorrhoeae]ACF31250.1 Hypothetical protein NGK_2651 [Neisseria gonorrhoeae NCCP11945]MCU4681282.1 hypothetical protein [Neisseria gonorrhoeae]UYA65829.1 hypothetical protein NDL70_11725 [Neisseria gonorrhoeae]